MLNPTTCSVGLLSRLQEQKYIVSSHSALFKFLIYVAGNFLEIFGLLYFLCPLEESPIYGVNGGVSLGDSAPCMIDQFLLFS